MLASVALVCNKVAALSITTVPLLAISPFTVRTSPAEIVKVPPAVLVPETAAIDNVESPAP